MGTDLLVFAVVMASLAVGLVIVCVITEATEAWNISGRGWAQGHSPRHAYFARRHHSG